MTDDHWTRLTERYARLTPEIIARAAGRADPEELAEGARAAAESEPFDIGDPPGGPAVSACEECGTDVMQVLEARRADGPGRKYRPAMWETAIEHRHTPRRCAWMKAQSPG